VQTRLRGEEKKLSGNQLLPKSFHQANEISQNANSTQNSFAIVLHIEEKLLQKNGIYSELYCSEKEASQPCYGHLQ